MTKTKEKTQTVYKLEVGKTEITESDRETALEECCSNTFNENNDINNEFLDNGDVIISDDAYYSTDKSKLEKLIQSSEIKDGDRVFNEKLNRFGQVFTTKGGQLRVMYDGDTKANSVLLTGNWQRAASAVEQAVELIEEIIADTDLEIDENAVTALEKYANELVPIEGEIVHDEKPEDYSRETHYATVKESIKHKQSLLQKIPVMIGYDLAELHEQQLYLVDYPDFETCVKTEFNIVREYAYELMEAAIIHEQVVAELGNDQANALAIKSFGAFAKTSVQIGKRLGFEGSNAEILASVSEIVRTNIRTVADIAPKRDDGSPIITQQTTKGILDTVVEFVQSNTAEYDGEQIPLDKANESGLTPLLAENQALQVITEQIKSKKEYLRDDYLNRKKNTEKGVAHNGKLSTATEIYKGVVPELKVSCTQHGGTFIDSIGNGKIQTYCGCRWYINHNTEDLECYECNDKAIVSVSDTSDTKN